MNDVIEGTIYGDSVRVSTTEAESLIANDEWGEPDHPNTQGFDQQPAVSEESTAGKEATVEEAATQGTEQPAETESAPSVKEEEYVELSEVDIDGETYSVDDMKSFINDSRNKDEWQRKNTQRSQDLANERKALRAESEKWNSLKQDDELMDTLKDFIDTDHPLFKENSEVSEEPELSETQDTTTSDQKYVELEAKVTQMEAEKQVERDVAALTAAHPELVNDPEALDQVLNVAVDQNLMDLETAYAVTAYQAAEDSALNKALTKVEKAKELQEIPETKGAARGERVGSTKKPANYDEARELAYEYNLYEQR